VKRGRKKKGEKRGGVTRRRSEKHTKTSQRKNKKRHPEKSQFRSRGFPLEEGRSSVDDKKEKNQHAAKAYE